MNLPGATPGRGLTSIASKLNKVLGDTEGMQTKITRLMNSCIDAGIDLEEADEEAQVDMLETSMRTLVDLQKRLDIERDTLRGMRTQLLASPPDSDVDWVTLYDQTNESTWTSWQGNLSENDKYGKHPVYRKFREALWAVKNDGPLPSMFEEDGDDDEVVLGAQKISLYCPLSRQLFENPMQSSECGHSFSKSAVIGYIRQNNQGEAPCPVPGCDTVLKLATLLPNRLLARKVDNHLISANDKDNDNEYEEVEG
ncbi:hypothetical protein IWQ61_010533 [Dispira simplex]|nr:hypothetical protein IWQ61_010533 [Dispira simplex]